MKETFHLMLVAGLAFLVGNVLQCCSPHIQSALLRIECQRQIDQNIAAHVMQERHSVTGDREEYPNYISLNVLRDTVR
jgi:hypothetical protein